MHRAVLLSALLLAACTAGLSPASAQLPACMDGLDNDLDGRADWTSDGGCSSPQDDDERHCTVELPDECLEEATPCPGILPPMGLTATAAEDGVFLDWQPPLSGAPEAYIIYRWEMEPTTETIHLTIPWQTQVALQRTHIAAPLPAWVDAQVSLPQQRVPSLTVHAAAMPFIEPIAAVDGDITQFLDTTADLDASYVYFVEAAGFGCRSAPSSPAFYNNILRVEDCWYVQPSPLYYSWPPTTDCLETEP